MPTNALKRANIRYIGKAKVPVINKCAADCDLTVTGDQTSKRSDEQYKYEEKMCGLSPKAQPSEKQISTYVVKSGMKNTRLADLKALYA